MESEKEQPKRYEINTIEELLAVVTVENMENFIEDFKAFLAVSMLTKTVQDAVGAKGMQTKFVWIDDGKHDIKIDIHEKKIEKDGDK